jgi:ATP-dependent Clp protease adaptor protein ClpS
MASQRETGADWFDRRNAMPPAVSVENDRRGQSAGLQEHGIQVAEKTRPSVKRPKMYKLLMLNDDYTPMEFVVHVLQRFFEMSEERAVKLMLQIHNEGKALIGVFTYEIAETKVAQVTAFARKNQHPLRCAVETE